MAIKIFFHICAITRAEHVVKEFIRSIHFSGLYDEVHLIYCYISGVPDIIQKIIELLHLSGGKFVIIKCIPHDTSYERLTLEDIHNHVDKTDKILYIHSKGVREEYQHNQVQLQCIDAWRDTMLYYLIRHYKKCINLLDNYDTIGINYYKLHDRIPHWSGNFWWVRGDYFLTLPHKIGPGYNEPELNFLFINNPSWYELYHMTDSVDCYYVRYDPFKYIDNKLE